MLLLDSGFVVVVCSGSVQQGQRNYLHTKLPVHTFSGEDQVTTLLGLYVVKYIYTVYTYLSLVLLMIKATDISDTKVQRAGYRGDVTFLSSGLK